MVILELSHRYTCVMQVKINDPTYLFRQLVHGRVSEVVGQLVSAGLHPGRGHVVDAERLRDARHRRRVEKGLWGSRYELYFPRSNSDLYLNFLWTYRFLPPYSCSSCFSYLPSTERERERERETQCSDPVSAGYNATNKGNNIDKSFPSTCSDSFLLGILRHWIMSLQVQA